MIGRFSMGANEIPKGAPPTIFSTNICTKEGWRVPLDAPFAPLRFSFPLLDK